MGFDLSQTPSGGYPKRKERSIAMPFFDSHAHLTDDPLYEKLELILERAQKANVTKILNICTDPISLKRALALDHPMLLHAAATPPQEAKELGEKDFIHFEKAAFEKKLVAIGETGLDYYYEKESEKEQKQLLIQYLHLAQKLDLPVIFHCREAFEDLFAITDQEYKGKAILHCFTGTLEEAKKVVDRNWYLSISGIVTFKKSEALREVVRLVPLENLLIETDAPYLAPNSQRGHPNEPSFLPETATMIAEVKKIPLEKVLEATFQNGAACFNFR